MPDPLCPTCHSKIGTQSTIESEREQEKQGLDSNGRPVPRWSDDPMLTDRGFSGASYVGKNHVKALHIRELQEAINEAEEEAGLPLTLFSNIETDNHIVRRHIIELREAIERILDASGASLADYFSFDDDGNPQIQNPKLGTTPQVEWVDIVRGERYVDKNGNPKTEFSLPSSGTRPSPTLPKQTKIRAIHIEDLRHPISVGTPALLVSQVGVLFSATKKGQANFTEVDFC